MQNKSLFLKEIFKYTKGFILALILVVGMSYVSASWSNPTGIAPNNNTPAPIDVGIVNQVKTGGLSLGALLVSGGAQFGGSVKITSGTPGNGKILTSDASGVATWQSSSAASKLVMGTGATMNLPSPGNYDVMVWSYYFTCEDFQASLRLDGNIIKNYTGAQDDTAGCDQNSINVMVQNIASGNHTFSIVKTNSGGIDQPYYVWIAQKI